ncbi:MAG: tetratricopeptide repeat protein [Nitrospirota bacterium]
MPNDIYNKWIKRILHISVYGIIFLVLITVSSCSREETTADKPAAAVTPSGPLIDSNFKGTALSELELDTNDPNSLAILGDKYFESNQYTQAIEIYEKVLKLNPNDVDTYNDLGLAYFYTGKSNIAVDRLKRGTEVVPSYQRVWLSLGFILLTEGRKGEAKPVLQRAVELDPESTVGREAKKMLQQIK